MGGCSLKISINDGAEDETTITLVPIPDVEDAPALMGAFGLAQDIADRAVRSEVELYAHGFEIDGHPVYDTTRIHEVGGEAEDLDIINAALAYIEARGDALPFVMKRQIDAPYLVRFEERTA